jgi:hypothetical protein
MKIKNKKLLDRKQKRSIQGKPEIVKLYYKE